jgi:hypothetical protein
VEEPAQAGQLGQEAQSVHGGPAGAGTGAGRGTQPGHRPSRAQGGLLGKENDPDPAGVLLRCIGPGGRIPA